MQIMVTTGDIINITTMIIMKNQHPDTILNHPGNKIRAPTKD
jgi:hypothetical protein